MLVMGKKGCVFTQFSHCIYFQDADAQVTFEDQQKINKFARCNVKLQDIKEELKAKKVKKPAICII